MKIQITLKNSFNPPLQILRDNYDLEILSEKHNELDYEAWTSSLDTLKGIFGPRNNWPGEVSSIAQNLCDLKKHFDEFQKREAYTYSILNKDGSKCLGCLYIRPTKIKEYSARVDFWFRDDSKAYENEFYVWLKNWLISYWCLENSIFPGRSHSWKEYYMKYDSIV